MGIKSLKTIVLVAASCFSCWAYAAPTTLAPVLPGIFPKGDGVNSDWVQVNRNWKGLSYYDPSSLYYNTQGINELRDHDAVMAMDRGSVGVDQGLYSTWTGTVANIDFADQRFNSVWGDAWGERPLAPVFKDDYQDNFAARFSGYIAIPVAGEYNLGVLFDDGFRFELLGGGGASVTLFKDGLNPPWDIASFADPLLLGAGLYAFSLDSYEHWEAGVISMQWQVNGADWSVIPVDNLFTHTVTPVPEPVIWSMWFIGLAVLGVVMRRKKGLNSVAVES